MARHLHEQSGGDPSAQGPVPELANEPRSPRSDDDFPDAPEPEPSRGPGGDLTDSQLQDFAARWGLADEPGGSAATDDSVDGSAVPTASEPRSGDRATRFRRAARTSVRGLRRPTARVLVVIGRVTVTAGTRVRSAGERLVTD